MDPKLPAVGYLSHFKDGFTEAWLGARDAAREADAHCLTFVMSKAWERDEVGHMTSNLALLEQAAASPVRALVSPYFARLLEPARYFESVPRDWARAAAALRRFPGRRVQLIEPAAEVASVEPDLREGTRALTRHLIEVHGCRRIAFVSGPPVAASDERRDGYLDALRAAGIEAGRAWVTPPRDWEPETGRLGVRRLLQVAAPPQAIVAACDLIALGAIAELEALGRRVPYDVAVTGVDGDAALNYRSSCGLTSLYQPFYEMGRRGVEIGLDPAEPQARERLSATRLVVRRSCGCLSWTERETGPDSERSAVRDHLREALLTDARGGRSRGFLRALEAELAQAPASEDAGYWQQAISAARAEALAEGLDAAGVKTVESGCHEARAFLGEALAHRQGARHFREAEARAALGFVLQELGSALSLDALHDVFTRGALRLGIPGWYLSRYEPGAWPPASARFLMGARGSERVVAAGGATGFEARRLLPDGVLPDRGRLDLLVLPLRSRSGPLGTVVMEAGSGDAARYQILADALGSALFGIHLYEEKSRFLSMVSHELRRPLAIVAGLSETLLEGEPSKTAREIHAHARHLSALVQDVLDLASSQVGQLKLHREAIDVGPALGSVIDAAEPMAARAGLRFEAAIAAGLPRVLADAARLRQVVLIFLSNAVKFTSAGRVTLRVEREGAGVRVCVSDTGLGVPAPEQAAIFDEFQQSARSAVRGYGGLGLGLAIARRLVEAHGGEIGVVSSGEEKGGSTFFFRLPALPPGREDVDAAHPAAATLDLESPQRILVVDDDKALLELHRRAVARFWPAAEVAAAADGARALLAMASMTPDLVVLDLMMPALDGFGVLEAMQKDQRLRTVPVVVLTAQTLTEAQMARFGAGVAAVLEKGLFSTSETLGHLARALARSARPGAEARRLVRRAMAFIHAHYAEPIGRAEICRHVAASERHLDRHFREQAQITPLKYLNRYRVQKAKALLRARDKSITEIALEVGFASSSYFGEIFRRETGLTPRAFRAQAE